MERRRRVLASFDPVTNRPLPLRSVSRDDSGESPREAEDHEKACRACVPKFFARVEGAPRGDAQAYIAAWRAYRGCLDRER